MLNALIAAALTAAAVTAAFALFCLLAAALLTLAERRHADLTRRAQAVYDAYDADLEAIARATRENPPHSLAWGPPARCGCRLAAGRTGQPYWVPCQAHERQDADFDRWQAELGDHRDR